MHAALSVLGTMAGQYLAAQTQAAQAQSQAQPLQAQPAFNASSVAQTTTNAVNLCNVYRFLDACGTLIYLPCRFAM